MRTLFLCISTFLFLHLIITTTAEPEKTSYTKSWTTTSSSNTPPATTSTVTASKDGAAPISSTSSSLNGVENKFFDITSKDKQSRELYKDIENHLTSFMKNLTKGSTNTNSEDKGTSKDSSKDDKEETKDKESPTIIQQPTEKDEEEKAEKAKKDEEEKAAKAKKDEEEKAEKAEEAKKDEEEKAEKAAKTKKDEEEKTEKAKKDEEEKAKEDQENASKDEDPPSKDQEKNSNDNSKDKQTPSKDTNSTVQQSPEEDSNDDDDKTPIKKGSRTEQFMAPQNMIRAKLGLPPLVWDKKLASYARWWAKQRKFDCNMEHSHGPYGENVYWGSDTSFLPFHCAEAWVDENKLYDYETNTCKPGQDCGHYTQIVWRNTQRVGCGKTVCVSGKGVFMVCEYDPPGNYVGERPY